ncbi:MAG: 6,7-dimethyl-8-ribityllumazine synthase [Omnitrophica bacterium RIFCSPLOWO2_01_FULL_50_24]|nr:MAG: 6,7-dimethyl-8-ribityllumazine synthase [Omnitrophica bacterium RIFCSPLOWO2_01_FULL_50_24]
MARVIEGKNSGAGLKIGIVISRFNDYVTRLMLDGALNELRRAEVAEADLSVIWVPGAFEIPLGVQTLIESEHPDGVVSIGCIIRGETSHYEHIAQAVSQGIERLALEHRIPIGFGVLTVEDIHQAVDRAGGKFGNRGRDAARSTVEMIHVLRAFRNPSERDLEFLRIMGRKP